MEGAREMGLARETGLERALGDGPGRAGPRQSLGRESRRRRLVLARAPLAEVPTRPPARARRSARAGAPAVRLGRGMKVHARGLEAFLAAGTRFEDAAADHQAKVRHRM